MLNCTAQKLKETWSTRPVILNVLLKLKVFLGCHVYWTRTSAISEWPCSALHQLKFYLLLHNCMTNTIWKGLQ